jgi:DNA repair protein RecN (Recombination protein N)
MLRELRIRNFAIIDDLTVEFRAGLNVITGETGAGKSVILQALALLCGERAAPELIRSDAEAATIEGLFEGLAPGEACEALGLSPDEDVLIRRVLPREGRARAYIGGSPATLAMLTQLGDSLVHIYGQHEQALLLRAASHRDLLDEFSGLSILRERMSTAYAAWAAARRRLDALVAQASTADERRRALENEAEELRHAAIKPDEETTLREQREILHHAERLYRAAREGEDSLYSGDGAVAAMLARLATQLGELARIDSFLSGPAELIDSARVQVEESALQLRTYAERIDVDPERLEEIEGRLAVLSRLAHRFAVSSTELPATLARIDAELTALSGRATEVDAARSEAERLHGDAIRLAEELSERRRRGARRLEQRMRSELEALGMTEARFRVRFGESEGEAGTPSLGPNGFDHVEFDLSANVGENPAPLRLVASGGELSRVMLALKALTATRSEKPILIFDEVDAGIGGGIADAVARRLKLLAANRQLLCITHLPQIAAYADHHFAVEKQEMNGRTIARARALGPGERVSEITRMLGDTVGSKEAQIYARRLVEQARERS